MTFQDFIEDFSRKIVIGGSIIGLCIGAAIYYSMRRAEEMAKVEERYHQGLIDLAVKAADIDKKNGTSPLEKLLVHYEVGSEFDEGFKLGNLGDLTTEQLEEYLSKRIAYFDMYKDKKGIISQAEKDLMYGQ